MFFLYNIFIQLYYMSIHLASLFSRKAKLWIKGRKDQVNILNTILPHYNVIWVHCASLGEFEQGRPIIEALKKQHPEYKILLTFFSPSGYEIRKNYSKADYIFYLPIDTRLQAKEFIDAVSPKIAIFVKYEFWFNYIDLLNKKNIPTFIISAIFRPHQYFFKWYGRFFTKMLKRITHFFVQNEESKKLLQSIGINQVTVSGDTRFDRVDAIAQQSYSNLSIEKFIENGPVFIAGSTWPKDEELIISLIKKQIPHLKFIIVPHEIDEKRIQSLIKRIPTEVVTYSNVSRLTPDTKVLIVDTIGMLSSIYRYATIAYIGGGFGKGIHNILEAVAYNKPILFGPTYQKFQEANDLVNLEGAYVVNNQKDLFDKTNLLLNDTSIIEKTKVIQASYIQKNKGASDCIIKHIESTLKN